MRPLFVLLCFVVSFNLLAASRSPENAITALSIDNDLFTPFGSDKDYTAGFAVGFKADSSNPFFGTLQTTIAEKELKLLNIHPDKRHDAWELGSYGFTPEDIEQQHIDKTDRPYANIIYLASSRVYRANHSEHTITSTLTLGVLGSNLFPELQNTVHQSLGGDRASAWDSQIADGGELTARYQLGYHIPLSLGDTPRQAKLSYFGSIGYLSEAGIALSSRRGQISSPDHRFNPALTSYGETSSLNSEGSGGEEHYIWGGIGLKARAYNAFLQGQFRDSPHTLGGSDLRPFIIDAWAGYTFSLTQHTKLSYVLRGQTSEIKHGTGDRQLAWGGLILSIQ